MSDTTNQPAKKQKTDETAPVAEARMMTTSGGLADTSGRTSETPVSIPPTITYGLQDTHTTVLPTCFHFACVNLDPVVPLTMKLRLNSYNDIICGSTNIKGSISDTTPWFVNRKLQDKQYSQTLSAAFSNFPPFPSTLAENADPQVWYRDWFAEMYEYYTVLGVEYEIIYYNPRSGGRNSLVAYSVETSGTTAATQIPEATDLRDLYGFKNIQYRNLQSRDQAGERAYEIIKGTYKPGSAKRDVSNDGNVKLWTRTAANATPEYIEALQLMHYQHPLSSNSSTDEVLGFNLNVQIRMKYIVQFKQLKQQIKYPLGDSPPPVVGPTAGFPTVANPYV